jgi:hypothetical protein
VHRSRLSYILIDCSESSTSDGAEFWSRALGLELDPRDPPGSRYVHLVGQPGPIRLTVQRVSSPSGFHLDIETDDVEAEVARLEALGAVRKYKIETWWVMRAPTGHDFCVIRPQSEDFARDPDARVWNE